MRKGRLLAIALIGLGLAPGTLLRTPVPPERAAAHVSAKRIVPAEAKAGPLEITGIWELASDHPFFGGFSGLVHIGKPVGSDKDLLLLGSDRGLVMRLPLSEHDPRAQSAKLAAYWRGFDADPPLIDLEALAYDPADGTLWAAYEGANTILRQRGDARKQSSFEWREPGSMSDWRWNSGPETMVRLRDGRFLVIAEGRGRPDGGGPRSHPGLLFASDPVEPQSPLEFRFAAPPEYAPVDATALPDGRVLILLRRVRWGVPVRFDAAIAIADPSKIEAGEVWSGEIIAPLAGPLLAENFEGIAYARDRREAGSIFIVSDDNFSAFQQTLLVRLEWPDGLAARDSTETSESR